MADMNSGVINQRTTYAQGTPPSNNSESVIWIDTSVDPNNPKVYDTATSAWLPVNTTATVISQTKPTVEVGKIWFEPVSNGVNMYSPSQYSWDFIQFLPDIPGIGLKHHYVSSEISANDGESITSRSDLLGTDNQSGSGTYISNAINGESGVRYNESNNDGLEASFGTNVSEPYHVFIVGHLTDSLSDYDYFLDGGSSNEIGFGRYNNQDDYILSDSTSDTGGGSPDQNPHIFEVRVDGTSSIAVVDGTTIIGPRDHDGPPLTGLTTGKRADNFGYSDFVDCESAVYDASKANFNASNVRSYLSNKYNITV